MNEELIVTELSFMERNNFNISAGPLRSTGFRKEIHFAT